MRVKRVFAEKLFGLFDHSIPLNMDDRVTIIHAPNGFGKTAILRMLDGLFNSRYGELRAFPFATFGVELQDGRTLRVTKGQRTKASHRSKGSARENGHLQLDYDDHPSFDLDGELNRESSHFPLDVIDNMIPSLNRIGPEEWKDEEGYILGLAEVLRKYREFLPKGIIKMAEPPDWFRKLEKQVQVRFIRTDRLVPRSGPSKMSRYERHRHPSPTVTTYSEELASEIGAMLKKYGEVSQALDRTFPVRLMQPSNVPELTKEEIKSRLQELEAKRTRLIESGVLDQERAPSPVPETIDDARAGMLSVYIRDVAEKLSVFDTLATKIDLFRSIINRRFRHKRMIIDKERGILFTTDHNQSLPPASLSSGEQHELVLLYELLFKVHEDLLILIDEPEISLHVAWQEQFLRDLLDMARLSGFDILLATHSPQIISDRWDLTVELEDIRELQETVR
ncbi:MAG: AAA family ATPase [Thermoguttaceae bacterium]|jgi:predicted ATP-binding protein involved in virulence|nr:AAA family ATPase [Thermoguttaceae bacterium]